MSIKYLSSCRERLVCFDVHQSTWYKETMRLFCRCIQSIQIFLSFSLFSTSRQTILLTMTWATKTKLSLSQFDQQSTLTGCTTVEKDEKDSSSNRFPIRFYTSFVHGSPCVYACVYPFSSSVFKFHCRILIVSSVIMPSIIHLTLIIFLIFNVCSANIHHNLKTKTISYKDNQQCRSVGEICHRNSQCCSQLSCSVLKGRSVHDEQWETSSENILREKSLFTIDQWIRKQTSIGRSDSSTVLSTICKRTRPGIHPWKETR